MVGLIAHSEYWAGKNLIFNSREISEIFTRLHTNVFPGGEGDLRAFFASFSEDFLRFYASISNMQYHHQLCPQNQRSTLSSIDINIHHIFD